jgi:hypothetical protein
MNFLRGATELLSGALKSGPAVCADVGKLQYKLDGCVLPWSLYDGKKKGTDESVSIFIMDVAADAAAHEIDAARNMIKKLKTCRHPGVLQCAPFLIQHENYVICRADTLTLPSQRKEQRANLLS